MKCLSCDRILTDFEATRKYASTESRGEYVELCNKCFNTIEDFPETRERLDLLHEEELLDEEEIYNESL